MSKRRIKDMELGEMFVCSKHHVETPLTPRMKREQTRICDACHKICHRAIEAQARKKARDLRPLPDDGSGVLGEEWRSIPEHVGYEASNFGRIRSARHYDSIGRLMLPRVLAPYRGRLGYFTVTLSVNGKTTNGLAVHRLIASAFLGAPQKGFHVAHWDGNPSNNHIQNLRYATPSENNLDKHRHGTAVRGKKLNPDLVQQARNDMAQGMQLSVCARKYGITSTTMYKIRDRLLWRFV